MKAFSFSDDQVFSLHRYVLDGLETGELVPERPAEGRRRIVLVPRPALICEFLRTRQPRVVDRISPNVKPTRARPEGRAREVRAKLAR